MKKENIENLEINLLNIKNDILVLAIEEKVQELEK